MERFTGVNKQLLYKLKLDFLDFVSENFEFFENVFSDHLRLYNDMFSHIPANYIGSTTYLERKKRFYDGVCDTYCRVRLYAYLNGNIMDKFSSQEAITGMKIGRKFDELTTDKRVKKYREYRERMFVMKAYNDMVGVLHDDKGYSKEESTELSLCLHDLASKKEFRDVSETEFYEIYNTCREKHLRILEERAANYFVCENN